MTHIVALFALGIAFVSNRIKDGMENTAAINQDAQTRYYISLSLWRCALCTKPTRLIVFS
jgi:hypothetical protein